MEEKKDVNDILVNYRKESMENNKFMEIVAKLMVHRRNNQNNRQNIE